MTKAFFAVIEWRREDLKRLVQYHGQTETFPVETEEWESELRSASLCGKVGRCR